MQQNNEDLEKIATGLIRKAGTEEPSDSFTGRVMESVLASPSPVMINRNRKLFWFLLLIPVLAGIGWLISLIAGFDNIREFFSPGMIFTKTAFAFLSGMIRQIDSISLSPVAIILFLAVFSLLFLDLLLSGRKHLS